MTTGLNLFKHIATIFAPGAPGHVMYSDKTILSPCDQAMLGSDPVLLAVCHHAFS